MSMRTLMKRLLRRMGYAVAALFVAIATGVLAFDILVVRPTADRIQRRLETAAPGERQAPAVVLDMLRRSHGDRLIMHVARYATSDLLDAGQRMRGLRRMSTEWGLMWLLPWHLSDAEIASTLLATAHMGNGVYGYAAAARRYFGLALEHVSAEQAARLVTIAWSPSSYIEGSERFERRVQRLLAKPPASAPDAP